MTSTSMHDGALSDLSNSLSASCPFDYDAVDGGPPEDLTLQSLEFLKRVISFIRKQPRKAVTIDCLFLATGDAEMDGVSFTSVAKAHGMTKQAISIRVKEIQEKLNLAGNLPYKCRSQKSRQASISYANSNWRPKTLN